MVLNYPDKSRQSDIYKISKTRSLGYSIRQPWLLLVSGPGLARQPPPVVPDHDLLLGGQLEGGHSGVQRGSQGLGGTTKLVQYTERG